MKTNADTLEQDYTVNAEDFLKEMIPAIEDFFTASARCENANTLNVTFTNGEKFELCVRKL